MGSSYSWIYKAISQEAFAQQTCRVTHWRQEPSASQTEPAQKARATAPPVQIVRMVSSPADDKGQW